MMNRQPGFLERLHESTLLKKTLCFVYVSLTVMYFDKHFKICFVKFLYQQCRAVTVWFPKLLQGKQTRPDIQICSSDPGYLVGDSSCCSGSLVHWVKLPIQTEILVSQAEKTMYGFQTNSWPSKDPSMSRELSDWLSHRNPQIPTLRVKIVTRREERNYGKSFCMHSIVTKASTGDRQGIHSSAFCSVSGPEGLEYNFLSCPFIGHVLLWPFLYKEQQIGCSITDPRCLLPIQMNNVIDCRLQCLIDLVSFFIPHQVKIHTDAQAQVQAHT